MDGQAILAPVAPPAGVRRLQFPGRQRGHSRRADDATAGRNARRHPCLGTSQELGTATARWTLRPGRTAATTRASRFVASPLSPATRALGLTRTPGHTRRDLGLEGSGSGAGDPARHGAAPGSADAGRRHDVPGGRMLLRCGISLLASTARQTIRSDPGTDSARASGARAARLLIQLLPAQRRGTWSAAVTGFSAPTRRDRPGGLGGEHNARRERNVL